MLTESYDWLNWIEEYTYLKHSSFNFQLFLNFLVLIKIKIKMSFHM